MGWFDAEADSAPRYRHTCLLLSPVVFTTNQPPFLAYISPREKCLKGGSVGKNYHNRKPVVRKELLMTRTMDLTDFYGVLDEVLRALKEDEINTASMHDYAISLLNKFDSSTLSEYHGSVRIRRVPCYIHLVTLETPWQDEVMEQWEPSSCSIF